MTVYGFNGDYNPAYLDGLSQLRATEGDLMLHPSPSDDFLFEKSQSSKKQAQHTKKHVTMFFFIDFLCRIPFRKNKILSSAQLSQLFF